jgi:hypothetical protein
MVTNELNTENVETEMTEQSVSSDTETDGGEAVSIVDPGPITNTGITPETVFEVLSNQRRRYVLHFLKARGERVTVRELSEQIAAWENGIDRDAVVPKERKRVYTALHQTHLPKMAKVGVIDYDRDRGTLELTDAIAAFDIYLEVVPEAELDWSEFYLALGAIATALVSVSALGLYPFSLLPAITYALLISVGLLAVAAVHYISKRGSRLGDGDPTATEFDLADD